MPNTLLLLYKKKNQLDRTCWLWNYHFGICLEMDKIQHCYFYWNKFFIPTFSLFIVAYLHDFMGKHLQVCNIFYKRIDNIRCAWGNIDYITLFDLNLKLVAFTYLNLQVLTTIDLHSATATKGQKYCTSRFPFTKKQSQTLNTEDDFLSFQESGLHYKIIQRLKKK